MIAGFMILNHNGISLNGICVKLSEIDKNNIGRRTATIATANFLLFVIRVGLICEINIFLQLCDIARRQHLH